MAGLFVLQTGYIPTSRWPFNQYGRVHSTGDAAFRCASAATLPQTDAVPCGASSRCGARKAKRLACCTHPVSSPSAFPSALSSALLLSRLLSLRFEPRRCLCTAASGRLGHCFAAPCGTVRAALLQRAAATARGPLAISSAAVSCGVGAAAAEKASSAPAHTNTPTLPCHFGVPCGIRSPGGVGVML